MERNTPVFKKVWNMKGRVTLGSLLAPSEPLRCSAAAQRSLTRGWRPPHNAQHPCKLLSVHSHSGLVPAQTAVLHGLSCLAPGWVHEDEGLSEMALTRLIPGCSREPAAADKPRSYLEPPSVGDGVPSWLWGCSWNWDKGEVRTEDGCRMMNGSALPL